MIQTKIETINQALHKTAGKWNAGNLLILCSIIVCYVGIMGLFFGTEKGLLFLAGGAVMLALGFSLRPRLNPKTFYRSTFPEVLAEVYEDLEHSPMTLPDRAEMHAPVLDDGNSWMTYGTLRRQGAGWKIVLCYHISVNCDGMPHQRRAVHEEREYSSSQGLDGVIFLPPDCVPPCAMRIASRQAEPYGAMPSQASPMQGILAFACRAGKAAAKELGATVMEEVPLEEGRFSKRFAVEAENETLARNFLTLVRRESLVELESRIGPFHLLYQGNACFVQPKRFVLLSQGVRLNDGLPYRLELNVLMESRRQLEQVLASLPLLYRPCSGEILKEGIG